MSKLIKLTDEIGSVLEKRAKTDNTSLAGEIKLLLDGKDDNNINQRLDKMAAFLKKELGEIRSLIEDTSVDRLAGGAAKTSSTTSYLEWDDVREMMYDYATDDDWVCVAAHSGMEDSNVSDEAQWFVQNGYVVGEFYGQKQAYLKLTPHIINFLKGKGYEL